MKYTTSLALLGVASLAAADMQQSKRSHSPGKCNSDKPGHGHGCGDHGHGHGHGCAVDKDFIKAGDLEFGILPDDVRFIIGCA